MPYHLPTDSIHTPAILELEQGLDGRVQVKGHWTSITSCPNFFQKRLGFLYRLEVLAWVMTTCWVLRSRLIYFQKNVNISCFFYFSKLTLINTQYSSLWGTLKMMLYTKYLIKWKRIARISWKFRYWFNLKSSIELDIKRWTLYLSNAPLASSRIARLCVQFQAQALTLKVSHSSLTFIFKMSMAWKDKSLFTAQALITKSIPETDSCKNRGGKPAGSYSLENWVQVWAAIRKIPISAFFCSQDPTCTPNQKKIKKS